MKTKKPLGKKSYGSIPHLLGSKLGSGDHHVHEGQHRICTEKTRDKHDLIIVQEKYDGSNVGVAKINGELVALTRSGYTARSSPYQQHHVFADWADRSRLRFNDLLNDGDRLCGEWLYQAHGIKYQIPDEPFLIFDYFEKDRRLPYYEFHERVDKSEFSIPRILFLGHSAVPLASALESLYDKSGRFIDCEKPEGLIYRVEKQGKVDFLAKFVRPDFEPGIYLPEISGQPEVYNFAFQ